MTTRSIVRAAALTAIAALAVAPARAAAHAFLGPDGDSLTYIAPDATSKNTLSVRSAGTQIEFHDPTVDGGIDPGACTPGELGDDPLFGEVIIQAFCPATGVRAVRVYLGEREDSATVALAITAVIYGGPGADRISGGSGADELGGEQGDDTVAGGDGPDVLIGGRGVDDVSGDSGDDDIRVRDGIRDIVRCGAGADTVDADTLDEIDGDCESVTRTQTTARAPSTGTDRTAPRISADAPARQRIGRTRRIRIFARSTEGGSVAASGTLNIAGLRVPLNVVHRSVTSANQRVGLTVTLTQQHWRRALSSLRRNRAVTARLDVVATDRAGNSRKARTLSIRLLR